MDMVIEFKYARECRKGLQRPLDFCNDRFYRQRHLTIVRITNRPVNIKGKMINAGLDLQRQS